MVSSFNKNPSVFDCFRFIQFRSTLKRRVDHKEVRVMCTFQVILVDESNKGSLLALVLFCVLDIGCCNHSLNFTCDSVGLSPGPES